MRKDNFTAEDHLYIQVSEGIEKMIAEEILKIGDKLPSVRVLSEEYGISMGTAFQAYYHLEGKGLIESRPKSGYYVRFNHRRYPELPKQIMPEQVSHDVSVKEMIASIYTDIAAATNVINLAMAVPDISLLPAAKLNKSVVYALRNSKDHCISYERTQGNFELRKQIAKLAFNWGGKINADEIVVTSGCLEAVTLCLRTVTVPGDTVAIECPTYFGISQAIESLGLKVVEINASSETGPDLDCLQKAIRKFPIKACVFVPNFNNPLGSCMPDEKKKKLVEIITKHNIPLIEDDIYGELYFGKNRPRTCKFYDSKGLVMHCSSLSKSLAPGYRIGWVIPGKFFEEVKGLKRGLDISCPTITQAAMAHFLENGRYEYHLKNLRRALYTQCLRYIQGIIQYFPEDTKISRPQGGFVLWVELNKKINAFKLRTEAIRHKISIVPGKIFSSGCSYSNFIRISFGKPWDDDADYGLMMLGRIIKKML
ncbi:MAG: PLP-dependent aminotransferase family protein [Bacteroidetes bacterium]|nr:PLP-dependent aminotransferase family protein [Bacteroidota bacterium]MBS1930673.1 PLP-dependent aminotransferase family protein [Bacteroidota bacterium]